MSNPTSSGSPGTLTVDLDALAGNYRALRKAAPASECGAVVKADAYGLGIAPVARRLYSEGCRRFFVANAAEGVELRAVLPEAGIYVFEGVPAGTEETLTAARLVPVLNSPEQIRRWRARAPAAVHIDSGMSRLGLGAEEVREVAGEGLLDDVEVEYVITHLACADEPSHALTTAQLERFHRLRRELPAARTSIASSPGILLDSSCHGDLVRPGIALYGGNPFISGANPMEAVVTLQGVVLQTREVTEPVTVGYGATCTVRPPARLAAVGAGYADGYPRALSNRGVGWVAGVRVPVVGRVSMDLITLDVSAVPSGEVCPGTLVELLGPHVSLDEVAAAASTIGYEILAGLGRRWTRRYLPE